MKKIKLGRTGLDISQVILGGGWVGGLFIDPNFDIMEKAIELSIKAGINWIDTAESYSEGKSEKNIGDLGQKAREGKITIEDLQGGTFTITNGGIYGSMLSTPILNPPQSAVLGMHNIIQRPVVVEGKVEVRPVMYLALSYDHRIIDGKEAVSFLKIVKESLEQPKRLFLNI